MYKVMIADDEPIMRKALKTLINWEEIECEIIHIALNGQEVLEHIEQLKPDILLLDIKMPGADGLTISKYIWENNLNVKVILLTAYADFSYAQLAIKYNVVDYVTKTGAFDTLYSAIEKAKAQIRRGKDSSVEILKENYLKAVIAGIIFDKRELEEKAKALSLEYENGYIVMLFHFRNEKGLDNRQRKIIHKRFLDFLHMVLGNMIIQKIATKVDTFAIFLKVEREDFKNEIEEKCKNIIELMYNFFEIQICVGISSLWNEIEGLKKAYNEANYSLKGIFLDEKTRINFYENLEIRKGRYSKELDKKIEEICYCVKKGESEKSLILFKEFVDVEKRRNESVDILKECGIIIINKCGKMLLEFNRNLYDLIDDNGSAFDKVCDCLYIEEYEEIINEVINKTAECIKKVSSKKNVIICECEKYIDENYEKYITVSDIARKIGVTPSYLSRIFRDITGDTVINSINKKKLEKAKEYLEYTDMRVYEISDALGFENITYFSHFFKKYTGISPKDYKNTIVNV